MLLANHSLYVALDWGTSLFTFSFMVLVYRMSDGGGDLSHNSWLLNLITTSLFISMAAQYLAMLKRYSVLHAYCSILPVWAAESALLLLLVPLGQWILLVYLLAANLFYQCVRGYWMSSGRLAAAALAGLTEQVLRLSGLLVLLTVLEWDVSQAMIGSTAIAYTLMLLFSLAVWFRQRSPIAWKPDFTGAWKYAAFYLGVYLISSADILSVRLQHGNGDLVALLKPWGQMIYTLSLPFINVLLSLWGQGRPSARWMLRIVLLYAAYWFGTMLFAGSVNALVFHHALPSRLFISLTVLEHICISAFSAVAQRLLQEDRSIRAVLALLFSSAAGIAVISYSTQGVLMYTWFTILFALSFGLSLSLYFRK